MPALKNIITPELQDQVKRLYNQGLGDRKIADQIGISRQFVRKIYKSLNISGSRRNQIIYDEQGNAFKKCRVDGAIKPIEEFQITNPKTGLRETRCNECSQKYRKQHYEENKSELLQRLKDERKQNPDHRKTFEERVSLQDIEQVKKLHTDSYLRPEIERITSLSRRDLELIYNTIGEVPNSLERVITDELRQDVMNLYEQD